MPSYQEVKDTGVDRRLKQLITDQHTFIQTGKNVPRKVKRSAISWGDARTGKTRDGRDFWIATVGVGAAVAGVSAVAFATLTIWPAVAVGVVVGAASWYGKKKAKEHAIKRDVLKKIANMHMLVKDPVTIRRLATVNQNPIIQRCNTNVGVDISQVMGLSGKDLAEKAYEAEAMLTILCKETDRLFDKTKKYKRKLIGGDPEQARNLAVRAATQSREPLLIPQRSISGHWYKGKDRVRGSKDYDTAKLKLAIILKRLRYVVKYLDDYFDVLQAAIEAEAEKLNNLEQSANLSKFIREIIMVGPRHINCKRAHCYQPEPGDLQLSGKGKEKYVYDESNIKVGQIGLGDRKSSPLKAIEKFQERYDQDEQTTLQEMTDVKGDFWVDTTTEAVMGTSGEVLEPVIEAGLELGSGVGPDVVSGGFGWILSVAIGEAVKSIRVNRPAFKAAKGIRKQAYQGGLTSKDLASEIDKLAKKTSSSGLERILSKVHAHYLARIAQRNEKLDKLAAQLKNRPQQALTCSDARDLVRYYLKVYHYVDKAYVNLIFINRVVESLEARINLNFNNAVQWV